MHLQPRLLAKGAALGVILAAAVTPFAAAAHATAPTISATPSTNLRAGDVISVSGSGFTDTSTTSIVECSSLGSSGCDAAHKISTTTDGSGNLPATNFTVTAGAVGNGTCPSATGTPCYLVVDADPADPSDASDVALATLSFNPVLFLSPATNVAPGGTISVSGTGFAAKKPVYLVECGDIDPSTNVADCDDNTLILPETNENGAFTGAKLKVHTGNVGGKNCNPHGTCFVGATTDPTQADINQATDGTFTFGAVPKVISRSTTTSASAKPKGSKVTVKGTIKSAGKGVKGLKLQVLDRKQGTKTWHTAARATSSTSGAFKVSLKWLTHNEQYEVVHASQKVGSSTYKASASKVLTVKKK